MVKVLFIISQRNFNDTEYSVTKQTLENKNVEVIVSSITKEEAIAMGGLRVTPDTRVREANVNEYDALIIVGGSGSPSLMDYPEVLQRIKEFNEKNKFIGAICLAPVILGKAGIMSGIKTTVFPSDWAVASLKNNGSEYSKEHVVVDENIITADGPESAKQFAEKILEKLNV